MRFLQRTNHFLYNITKERSNLTVQTATINTKALHYEGFNN